jgi:hypothetical protein
LFSLFSLTMCSFCPVPSAIFLHFMHIREVLIREVPFVHRMDLSIPLLPPAIFRVSIT